MSCEICGRNMCTRSFHSLEEQERFDDVADSVKERALRLAKAAIDALPYEEIEGRILIDFEDAIQALDVILD